MDMRWRTIFPMTIVALMTAAILQLFLMIADAHAYSGLGEIVPDGKVWTQCERRVQCLHDFPQFKDVCRSHFKCGDKIAPRLGADYDRGRAVGKGYAHGRAVGKGYAHGRVR